MSIMEIAVGILAGGQARRFGGIAKGLLRDRRGKSIVERFEGIVRQSGIKNIVLLSNDPEHYESLGIPILPDLRPGNGPLGGIETALEYFAATCDAVLFMPCDLPGMTTHEIHTLLETYRLKKTEAVVAQTTSGEMQPLCAVLAVALRKKVSRRIDLGRLSVFDFLGEQQTETVVFENTNHFYNINTPDDWQRWSAENAAD